MSEYDPLLTLSALNMAVVSIHRIMSLGNRLILDREYDNIINNLRLNEINPDLTDLYQEILNVIHNGRVIDEVRAEIKKADSENKHKSVKEIISGNVLKSFSTNPLKWLGKLAMSSASEYFTQQKKTEELTKNNNEEQFRLRHDELNEYHKLQVKLLGLLSSLMQRHHLPGSYLLAQASLDKFSAVMNETDPSNRHEMMEYLERDFLMYSPYWFYRAKFANEAGCNNEAGKYFARFVEVWQPVLKKDPYRVEAMKYRIEELMRSGVTRSNVGEILKCLDEMRANTELDDWANNIFAGMVYFALGRKDEAVFCVRSNVLFRYEKEMSCKVLERMETEKLPQRIDPLPEKIETVSVKVPEITKLKSEPKPEAKPEPLSEKLLEPPKPEPEPIVQEIPPAPKPEPPKPKEKKTLSLSRLKLPPMSDNNFI